MNMVILPISNTPQLKFSRVKSIISMLVIIVAIGLPLSIIAKTYYSKRARVLSSNESADDELNSELPG